MTALPPELAIDALLVRFSGAADALTALEIDALRVPAGALVAVTGPSGSGKSTFLYTIAGLLRPARGTIAWGDRDIVAEPESALDRWRRRTVGFVFQDFHLLPELTPLQNVLLPASFESFVTGRVLRERAAHLLARLSVPHERASTAVLSRGEQQRVALARALVFDPPVILADEPTASLDAAAGSLVADTLARLSSEEGRTVIVVSHDPALIGRCTRRVALDHGLVAAAEAAS